MGNKGVIILRKQEEREESVGAMEQVFRETLSQRWERTTPRSRQLGS